MNKENNYHPRGPDPRKLEELRRANQEKMKRLGIKSQGKSEIGVRLELGLKQEVFYQPEVDRLKQERRQIGRPSLAQYNGGSLRNMQHGRSQRYQNYQASRQKLKSYRQSKQIEKPLSGLQLRCHAKNTSDYQREQQVDKWKYQRRQDRTDRLDYRERSASKSRQAEFRGRGREQVQNSNIINSYLHEGRQQKMLHSERYQNLQGKSGGNKTACISSIQMINSKIKKLLGLQERNPGHIARAAQIKREQIKFVQNAQREGRSTRQEYKGEKGEIKKQKFTAQSASLDKQQISQRLKRQTDDSYKENQLSGLSARSTLQLKQANTKAVSIKHQQSITCNSKVQQICQSKLVNNADESRHQQGCLAMKRSISLSKHDLQKLKSSDMEREQKLQQWRRLYGNWANRCEALVAENKSLGSSRNSHTFTTQVQPLQQSRNQTLSFATTIQKQINLDMQLRNLKRSLQLKVGSGDYDKQIIKFLAEKNWPIKQEDVRVLFVPTSEEFNPFAQTSKTATLQQLVSSFLNAQRHFKQKVRGSNYKQFEQELFGKVSQVGIQDLVRLINMQCKQQYRNRDLILIYRRLGGMLKLQKEAMRQALQ